ncbi:TetR/AcrR family transcriptional regulator [Ferruginibacter profundus]
MAKEKLFLLLLTVWLNYMVNKKKDDTTEEKILAAARKVFTTKGMAGARMQDIADEAGINKAMLHYYFRDKDKLFEVIFMEEANKFFPRINFIFESEAPLFEKIELFVNEYIDEMVENPYLPWFIMNEANRDAEQFFARVWSMTKNPRPMKFLEQIEKEVKKGTIKKVNPLHLLLNLLSMTIFPFIARPMIIKNLKMSDQQFEQVIEQRRKEIPKFIIDSIKK